MALWLYFLAINLLCFCLMAADKHKAKQHQWRISEKALLVTALLGGSVGGMGAMYLLRHKTNHPAFRFGLPAMFAAHCLLALWWFR